MNDPIWIKDLHDEFNKQTDLQFWLHLNEYIRWLEEQLYDKS